MKKNSKTRVILITDDQYAAIERLQQKEQERSALGTAPTVHAIARALFDKALSTTSQEKTT